MARLSQACRKVSGFRYTVDFEQLPGLQARRPFDNANSTGQILGKIKTFQRTIKSDDSLEVDRITERGLFGTQQFDLQRISENRPFRNWLGQDRYRGGE